MPQMDKCPMVILSHGFNGSGDDFTEYAKVLVENGMGACIFDFCGGSLRSKSDLSTTEMTVFTEKEDLLAVIDFAEHLIPAVWEENITGLFSNPIYIPRHPFYLKRLMTDIANEYKKMILFRLILFAAVLRKSWHIYCAIHLCPYRRKRIFLTRTLSSSPTI